MKSNKNEVLQSRRQFFKNAAKKVIPVIGLLIVEQVAPIEAATTSCYGYCGATCVGTCFNTCYNSCLGDCRLQCTGTCMGGCYTACGGWCTVCQV